MPSASSLGVLVRQESLPRRRSPLPPLPQKEAPPLVPVPARRLRAWNVAMTLFHASLAALTLGLGNRSLTVPTYKTVLDFVERPNATGWDLFPEYRESGELAFTSLVASFFLLSAGFHLLNASLLRAYYERELARCRTPTRWTEYFFSAGVMQLLIAYTLGIRERGLLLAATVLVSVTMPFGYWTEAAARPRTLDAWQQPLAQRLLPWALGHVPQAASWLLIVWQFYDSVADPDDRIPAFVHAILWSELALFFSFGFVTLGVQLRAPRHFCEGELAFQALSLASKGVLGGLLLSNVLMLSEFEDVYE